MADSFRRDGPAASVPDGRAETATSEAAGSSDLDANAAASYTATPDTAAPDAAAPDAATPDAATPDAATGSGALLARLATMSLIPTCFTAIAVACSLLLLGGAGERTAAPAMASAGAVLAVGLILQPLWVVRTTRGILAPVERLVRAIDEADGAALESLRSRPDWEISLLFRRVRDLLLGRARANEEYQALLHAHRQVEAAAAVLDRVATPDSPGDAGGFTGFLAPVGMSLRALIERLDRREAAVGSRILALRRALTEVSEEVRDVGGHFERAFLGLLEVVAGMKDARHAITAIDRELERAGQERAGEMVAKLGERADRSLEAMGHVSSDLERAATAARRLVARGERLARAAEHAGAAPATSRTA